MGDLQDDSSSQIEETSNHRTSKKNSQPPPPNHIHHPVKASLTDSDSVGMVSELSQFSSNNQRQQTHLHMGNTPQHQQVIIEEQVQKGVEKVLVAILEASKSKSAASGDSSCRSPGA